MQPEQAWALLEGADCVVDASAAAAAVSRVADEITRRLAGSAPLVLVVMGGGVVFAGQLLPLLRFPLDFDYVHATRYDGSTKGGELSWKVMPREPVRDRTVLVLDDILDRGNTLAAIRDWLLAQGAREVLCAVFCDKATGLSKPVAADFTGVSVPDRYVFGYGMDVNGAWRNLPAVYALKDPA